MSLHLTSEQFQLLQSQSAPVIVVDPASQSKYVILSEEEYHRMLDDDLRNDLQVAFEQAAAGDEAEWNLDSFLTKARREIGPSS